MIFARWRVLFEELAKLVVDDRLDDTLDLSVCQTVFVWPSNCGCGILTLMMTAVAFECRRQDALRSFARLFAIGVGLIVRSALRGALRGALPPSCVLMLFVNEYVCSA